MTAGWGFEGVVGIDSSELCPPPAPTAPTRELLTSGDGMGLRGQGRADVATPYCDWVSSPQSCAISKLHCILLELNFLQSPGVFCVPLWCSAVFVNFFSKAENLVLPQGRRHCDTTTTPTVTLLSSVVFDLRWTSAVGGTSERRCCLFRRAVYWLSVDSLTRNLDKLNGYSLYRGARRILSARYYIWQVVTQNAFCLIIFSREGHAGCFPHN